MEIHRPMVTENTRSLLLFLVIMTALSFVPMLSHAAVFWDDEMEEGNTDFSPAYMQSTMIPTGVMAYDTDVKFSGNGSIRVNFPQNCDISGSLRGQCGGSLTRQFPPNTSPWKRVYFRMSGSGPNPTANGLFKSGFTSTKMLKGETETDADDKSRHWWQMGKAGGKGFLVSMENAPQRYSTTDVLTSLSLQDNRWYCIETHEQMNTPGQSNGIAEAWVDGVKVLTKTDVIWQRAGSNRTWKEFSLMRQNGAGNFWWDRFAAGTTRIGCLGATSASDTTRPASPQGLVIR